MLSIALGQNRRYTILAISALDFVSRQRCLSSLHVRTCTMHPTPSNIRYRFPHTELNHCPNFHIAMSKFPEIRGLAYCTRVARAQCTTTPKIVHHQIALLELHQCTKFRVARSKCSEGEGAYAYAYCTCIARALCTLSRNDMYHRITLIEFHKCTKFGVNRSKFPRTGGPLPNKLFWSWRAQPEPQRNG